VQRRQKDFVIFTYDFYQWGGGSYYSGEGNIFLTGGNIFSGSAF
jgi:hypothetical protein